jgi:hypothetical protein
LSEVAVGEVARPPQRDQDLWMAQGHSGTNGRLVSTQAGHSGTNGRIASIQAGHSGTNGRLADGGGSFS